ncbi:MAG: NAD(P)H-binding protein [Actinomycetota bacterium]|nr:NAD(P)H-binding protein [Actinomycetota bacterium]
MTKSLVTGGTGLLGRLLVRAVVREGHAVRIMSQRPRPPSDLTDVEWAQVDIVSGEGLPAAVEGAETVFHLASDFRHPESVDVTGTRRLVDASRAAGVSHLVFISIVGVDDIPTRYYKRKREAESIIESSGIPHSIQRSTQFHSFVDMLLSKASRVPLVMPLPTNSKFQSVAEVDVAVRLAQCLTDGPRGRLTDFGGPDVLSFGEMARTWMEVKGIRKKLIHLPLPGAAAAGLRAGKNTAPDGVRGMIRWREWLEQSIRRSR